MISLNRHLGAYLRDFRARTSETLLVVYVSAIDGQNFWAKLLRTGGQVMVSRGAVAGAFQSGQVLTVTRMNASGQHKATEYQLIGLATSSTQNQSLTAAANDTLSKSTEVLYSLPASIVLPISGAAVTVNISGVNLSSPPIYGDSRISDSVAQVITSKLITIKPQAGAMPAGQYSLSVAGITIPKFFTVQ